MDELGRSFVLGSLAQEPLGSESIYRTSIHRTWLSTSATARRPFGSTGSFNPADPAIQSAGGFRSNSGAFDNNGLNKAPVQSDGPEETKDYIAALAVDFSKSFEGSTMSRLQFGGRASQREKKHQRFRYGLCAGTGSTMFGTPYDQNSQGCRPGLRRRRSRQCGSRVLRGTGLQCTAHGVG